MNRKQRRRSEAKGARGITAPASAATEEFSAADAFAFLLSPRDRYHPQDGTPPSQGYVFDSIYAATRRRFGGAPSLPRLLDTVREAQVFSEKAWASAQTRPGTLPEGQIACRKGCSWCCHQQVSVSVAEAIAITDHVTRRFAPDRLAALRTRLDALDQRTAGLGPTDYARTASPCAFLEEGSCSIHTVRPFRCRAYHSTDADYCHWKLDHPEEAAAERRERRVRPVYPGEPVRIFDGALRGMATAIRDSGFPGGAHFLTGAVRIALDQPDAGARWLKGEAVFAPALIPPDILAAEMASATPSMVHAPGNTGSEAPHSDFQETSAQT